MNTAAATIALPTFSPEIERRALKETDLGGLTHPVVIADALNHWPAIGKWTPQYLHDEFGTVEVSIGGQPWKLGELARRIMASTREAPAPYLHNYPLTSLPARMRADIEPMPECAKRNWLGSPLLPKSAKVIYPELYFGGTGAVFPMLHYDNMHTNAVLMQICGEKEYLVFAPDQQPYMYPGTGIETNKSTIDNPEGADPQRFPLYAQAVGTRFVLKAGETLFVPAGWWHTVRILTPSITISINTANHTNWREFTDDYCRMIAARSPLAATLLYFYMAAFDGFQQLLPL
jgi:hypothetical protein